MGNDFCFLGREDEEGASSSRPQSIFLTRKSE